jgi:hypothetical protein
MKRSPAWKMGLAGLLMAALAACGGGDDGPAPLSIDGHGVSTVDPGASGSPLAADPLQTPLSAAERASLRFMREEEQLAHDVYAASASRISLPIFSNIAALLVRYGVPDPMDARPAGSFATAEIQALHDSLVAASTVSLVEALKVGVEIEELDIRDIEAQKAGIDNADILMVYDQLLRGSRNHLRAFMKVLEQQGGSYAPKYISQAAFDAIVDSATETGS